MEIVNDVSRKRTFYSYGPLAKKRPSNLNRFQIIEFLVFEGSDVGIADVFFDVVHRFPLDVVKFFVYEGNADVNSVNGNDVSVLEIAVARGDPEIVKFLKSEGAK